MATKTVTINAVGIQNIRTGSDPGQDLEVYGDLGAWVKRAGSEIATPPITSHVFWKKVDAQRQSITLGATLFVGGTVSFDVKDNQELWFGGHIWEDDDISGDDDMGGHYERFPFNVIPRDREVRVRFQDRDNDQQVEAIFKVASSEA